MRSLFMAGLFAMALCGGAAAQQPDDPSPSFDFWGTGDGILSYNRLAGHCDRLEHAFGRNAAWGLWRIPLAQTVEDGPEEHELDGVVLRFRCLDGTACIQKGSLRETPERIESHRIPFGSVTAAHAFLERVADLKAACAAGR